MTLIPYRKAFSLDTRQLVFRHRCHCSQSEPNTSMPIVEKKVNGWWVLWMKQTFFFKQNCSYVVLATSQTRNIHGTNITSAIWTNIYHSCKIPWTLKKKHQTMMLMRSACKASPGIRCWSWRRPGDWSQVMSSPKQVGLILRNSQEFRMIFIVFQFGDMLTMW